MSALNGDRSRFQRLRKAGVHRRERARAAMAAMRLAAAPRAAASEDAGSGEGAEQPRSLRLVVAND